MQSSTFVPGQRYTINIVSCATPLKYILCFYNKKVINSKYNDTVWWSCSGMSQHDITKGFIFLTVYIKPWEKG